jgi:DNA-binding transcriptional MerR regulator
LEKAPEAFRTISEVAEEINVPQHVLRFWESRFTQIKPMKRGGGRRYYRPDDVDLVRGVRHLLYGEGYTIRGVQRILREQGISFVQNVWRDGATPPPPEMDEDRVDAETEKPAEEPGSLSSPLGFEPPPPPPQEAAPDGGPDERREPTLAPLMRADSPPRMAHDDRRKLENVRDELLVCRRLIETALTNGSSPEPIAEESGAD